MADVTDRIAAFHAALSEGLFDECADFVDPAIPFGRDGIVASLREFAAAAGPFALELEILRVYSPPSKLYGDCRFARGSSFLSFPDGRTLRAAESWVERGGAWYTRATGLIFTLSQTP